MTAPIREQVLDALLRQLKLVSYNGLCTDSVERNRDTFVNSFPSIVMVDGDHQAIYDTSGSIRYEMTVAIEAYIQANDMGTEINSLYAAIIKKLLDDPTLGGVSHDIREEQADFEISRAQGQKPVAACSILAVVIFYTAEADPFSG